MVAEPPQASRYLMSWRLGVVIFSLFLGTSLIALDATIVNVAIPHIAIEFDALKDVSWYGTAYLLTITAFQPIFGIFFKFFNVEITYGVCIVLFEAGSILCAAARSSPAFIVGRAVAGTGAAGLLQGALSIISHVVELEKRPMYMGIVVSVFVVSVCTGPILGGAFTTHSTWRWCFWINLPCGAVTIILLAFFLRVKNADSPSRKLPLGEKLMYLEPLGCCTFLGAVTCVLLALQWGGQSLPWKSPTVIGLLVGFVVLAVVFVCVQWKRGEKAMIPLRVLRQRSIWSSAVTLFWLSSASYLIAFYLPFYFQAVQGVDPMMSGIRLIPLMLPQTAALILAGAIVSKIGQYVPIMLLGEIVCVVGLALMTRLQVNSRTVEWASYLVITGLGLGAAQQLPYTAVQVALSEEDIPVGNAIAVFTWQLGGAIGIAVGQTIALNIITREAATKLPGLPPQLILAIGGTDLKVPALSDAAMATIREIWNLAITRTLILPTVTVAMAIPFTCCMEWLNAKNVAADRKAIEQVITSDHDYDDEEEKESTSTEQETETKEANVKILDKLDIV